MIVKFNGSISKETEKVLKEKHGIDMVEAGSRLNGGSKVVVAKKTASKAMKAVKEVGLDKKDLLASIKKLIATTKSKVKVTHTWMMTFEELLVVKSALETKNDKAIEKVLIEVRARREKQWPTKKVERK